MAAYQTFRLPRVSLNLGQSPLDAAIDISIGRYSPANCLRDAVNTLPHYAVVRINLAIEGINLAIDLLLRLLAALAADAGLILRFAHEPSRTL